MRLTKLDRYNYLLLPKYNIRSYMLTIFVIGVSRDIDFDML